MSNVLAFVFAVFAGLAVLALVGAWFAFRRGSLLRRSAGLLVLQTAVVGAFVFNAQPDWVRDLMPREQYRQTERVVVERASEPQGAGRAVDVTVTLPDAMSRRSLRITEPTPDPKSDAVVHTSRALMAAAWVAAAATLVYAVFRRMTRREG